MPAFAGMTSLSFNPAIPKKIKRARPAVQIGLGFLLRLSRSSYSNFSSGISLAASDDFIVNRYA
jgi:hypothetical protein